MSRVTWTQHTGHEYDGIQEYDNPIPRWWNWIFAMSIAFAVMYMAWYHLGTESSTIHDDWQAAQLAEYQRLFGAMGELAGDEPTILRMMDDPKMMALARSIFVGNCAQCHGKDGGGINGVNLTDDFYKNVRTLSDVFTTVTKGANNGAMPMWENRLSNNERVIMAAYAASLRGTKPSSSKGAEGNEIPAWQKAEAQGGSATRPSAESAGG